MLTLVAAVVATALFVVIYQYATGSLSIPGTTQGTTTSEVGNSGKDNSSAE
jgi:hypothetical protein